MSDAQKETWYVRAQGKVHGPFSAERMIDFVAEGRVVGATEVSRDASIWRLAYEIEFLAKPLGKRGFGAGAKMMRAPGGINLLVWCDIRGRNQAAFDAALYEIGQATQIGFDLWLVRTAYSISEARTRLAKEMLAGDRLLVVDSTHDRLGWFNLGPEIEARLREHWAPAAATQTPANS